MTNLVQIDGNSLQYSDVLALAQGCKKAVFPEAAREKVELARETVLGIIERGETAYGINTGFGSLSKVSINADNLQDLQSNLIRSHAQPAKTCTRGCARDDGDSCQHWPKGTVESVHW